MKKRLLLAALLTSLQPAWLCQAADPPPVSLALRSRPPLEAIAPLGRAARLLPTGGYPADRETQLTMGGVRSSGRRRKTFYTSPKG